MTETVDTAASGRAATACLFLKSRIDTEGYIAVVAESFRPEYAAVQPFLVSLAEPVSRPPLVHEYRLTPFSLGAAVSNGVTAAEAMSFLEEHSYELRGERGTSASAAANLRECVYRFITSCMTRYNLARVVVEGARATVQCRDAETATLLLQDALIRSTAVEPAHVFYETVQWGGLGDAPAPRPCFLLKSRAMSKAVAARCVVLGLPIQQQYDYEHDTSVRDANMTLRSQTRPRAYQVEAVEAATRDGTLNSGCLLLPCGAGKTLLGIMLMCKVKKPTLVVCAGSVSVEQWRNQILEYAMLDAPLPGNGEAALETRAGKPVRSGAARISCLTGKQKDAIDDDTDVVLTTYSMLVTAHKARARSAAYELHHTGDTAGAAPSEFTDHGVRKRKPNPKEKLFSSYGLLILDEVHVMPAESFQESLGFIDAKGVIGLTATYVREDRRILDLFHLVGPKLYDVSMESLASQGYLAKVNCIEVHTPMSREFGLEYLERSLQGAAAQVTGRAPALVMLAAANPNKMLCVRQLVERHLEVGSKILVFCDHIMLLYEYGKMLNAPVISGKTQHRDRLMIFSDFQSTSKVNVICVSRVGDVSVNLPSANVVIQVSSHGGSRRQEAQRLGRILRPKDRAANGKAVEAWFYSIISADTLELAHAAHRTAFLVDQGYTCRLMVFLGTTAALCTLSESRQGHAAASAEPGHGVRQQPQKGEPTGDITTIKQEQFRSGRPVHSRGAAGSPGTQQRTPVESLEYQLELLSKVVSSWEIEFQREGRKRGRDADTHERGGRNSRLLLGHRDAMQQQEEEERDDGDVVVVQQQIPGRSYSSIKSEWASAQHPGAPGQPPQPATVAISELVGVSDGFVYHEL